MNVKIGQKYIYCNIQYGSRKKIKIEIDGVGFITVKAPKNISQEALLSAIGKHGKWIKDRLAYIDKIKETSTERTYDMEGKFLYLGEEFSLHELIETEGISQEQLKRDLKKFYISACKKIIDKRIKPYEKQLRVKAKSIDIEESTIRWGSCNSNRQLTFNYRLAMAPLEVIDYIIVHELCHIKHMNHDRSFWRLVGSLIRDYKKSEEYLARYGQYMSF